MSAPKKPRSDSPLKTLPPERQAAIAEYALPHSLAETAAWLRADGLEVSATALSLWLSWYRLQQQLSRNESTVEMLLKNLSASRPDFTTDQLDTAGQAFFTALALEQQDPRQWHYIQQSAIKKEQLKLEARKVALAEANASAKQAVEEVGKRGGRLDPETKAEILAAIDRKLLGL